MTDFRDYLGLAVTLRGGATEAEWRSASSRADYAAFHVARRLLLALGFRVPQADRAHGYLWLRLAIAGATPTNDRKCRELQEIMCEHFGRY